MLYKLGRVPPNISKEDLVIELIDLDYIKLSLVTAINDVKLG